MDIFSEGSVPAQRQIGDKQEEKENIFIFMLEHCVGV